MLAIGRGVFELTGFPEADLMGRDVVDALQFSDAKPVDLAREWGVRRLGEHLSIRTRGGQREADRRRRLPGLRRRRRPARRDDAQARVATVR